MDDQPTAPRILPGTTQYATIHRWVKQHYAKTGRCERCGVEGATDYASVGHTYTKNRADWLELCKRCHVKLDTPPEDPALVRRIIEATRQVAAAAADLDEAIAERDRLIRAAIEEKRPYAEIARETGLSEPRLYQIRRGARI